VICIKCLLGIVQVQVSSIDNPEEASFFESYEAAHSMHDLSSSIAKVLPLSMLPQPSLYHSLPKKEKNILVAKF
jgi:hypothetical protein